MESQFRHDFSKVRIHTDSKAAESARAVNALAYTVGTDVVFGAGQYAPDSARGKSLLAHELMHTIQQNDLTERAASKLEITNSADALERQADDAGEAIMTGRLFDATTPHETGKLARQKASKEYEWNPTSTASSTSKDLPPSPVPTYGVTPTPASPGVPPEYSLLAKALEPDSPTIVKLRNRGEKVIIQANEVRTKTRRAPEQTSKVIVEEFTLGVTRASAELAHKNLEGFTKVASKSPFASRSLIGVLGFSKGVLKFVNEGIELYGQADYLYVAVTAHDPAKVMEATGTFFGGEIGEELAVIACEALGIATGGIAMILCIGLGAGFGSGLGKILMTPTTAMPGPAFGPERFAVPDATRVAKSPSS
jgi:hypothetical protein